MRELINLGIPAEIVESIGYGASRLRDLREEEEAHHRNRRVEFVIETAAMVQKAGPGASESKPAEPGVTQGTALPAETSEDLEPPALVWNLDLNFPV